MHLRRRAEDDGINVIALKCFRELRSRVLRTIFGRDLGSLFITATDALGDFPPFDQLQSVEMLFPERACACQCYSHNIS